MTQVVIVAGRRTPTGRFLGALRSCSAVDLGVAAAAAALADLSAPARDAIDQVIIGNVLGAGLGMNVARQIGLRCGLPERVPAFTVNMMCGSGMQAVILAAAAIRAGDAGVVLCGGTESMSNAPHLLQRSSEARRIGADGRADTLQIDGLVDPLLGEHMGVTAERLATRYRITREDQDAWAERSHRAYAQALAAGRFAREIIATNGIERDEHPRPGLTREALAALRPAFSAAGTVTPGNASGINDGSAMLVVADAAIAARHGWPVLARLVAWTSIGCDPATMGLGPVHALRRLRDEQGVRLEEHDRIEVNEAFAAQTIACVKELGLDERQLNGDGGAIALGHPIGASGARLLVHLAQCTAQGTSQRALATLCVGGGMGLAMALSA
jgi:acetyl-CoA C-acetyltransferase